MQGNGWGGGVWVGHRMQCRSRKRRNSLLEGGVVSPALFSILSTVNPESDLMLGVLRVTNSAPKLKELTFFESCLSSSFIAQEI